MQFRKTSDELTGEIKTDFLKCFFFSFGSVDLCKYAWLNRSSICIFFYCLSQTGVYIHICPSGPTFRLVLLYACNMRLKLLITDSFSNKQFQLAINNVII